MRSRQRHFFFFQCTTSSLSSPLSHNLQESGSFLDVQRPYLKQIAIVRRKRINQAAMATPSEHSETEIINHVELMHRLVNNQYPRLNDKEEELVNKIYEFVAHDVAIFAQAIQTVPPAAHMSTTPYVAGVLFRNKFGRVIPGQMILVGPERYSTVGMRVGKLIVMALIRHGGIELHTIEFLVHLFLQVVKESLPIVEEALKERI